MIAPRDMRTLSDSGPPVIVTSKPWWMSKTLWLNITAILIVFVGMLMGPEFQEILPKDWGKYLVAITAFLNVVLRTLSKSPLTTTSEPQ